jgi:N-acetylmuramoyl-L-alanine amidase
VYYVRPREWNTLAKRDSMIQVYRQYLEGRRIFLDPGHGGDDRVSIGPSGAAVEADVNLRVGLALREYLTLAGANVAMSRERDTSIALADRPQMAVRSGAEIFVSLHHNATGTGDDITNYSSVYYHARSGQTGYHPANQDLARYIQRDMSYAMRNPGPPSSPTFDGTLSDFDIYPRSGFAVLRQNPLPAALIEGSFFTHPHEERRLSMEEFNTIEAWGIFLGLGRYFRAGVPGLTLLSDSVTHGPRPPLLVRTDPWSEIDRRTADVRLDGVDAPWTLSDSGGIITVMPPENLKSGNHSLSVVVRNIRGNASWPFRKTITVMLPPAELLVDLHPSVLPPVPGATTRITCVAADSSGSPVADGTPIRVRALANGIDTVTLTKNGESVVYFTVPAQEGTIDITASSGSITETVTLPVHHGDIGFLDGIVRSRLTGIPVSGALISLAFPDPENREHRADVTRDDGRFLIGDTLVGNPFLEVRRYGFFPFRQRVLELIGAPRSIALPPVANGVLHGKTYVLDPRFGGAESGDISPDGNKASNLNLSLARRLFELLKAAGANVYLMRASDTTIIEAERIKRSAELPQGMYVRIDAGLADAKASCEIYRNITNRRFAEKLLRALGTFAGLQTGEVSASNDRFFNDVAMGTISLRLPSVTTGYFDEDGLNAEKTAWALFAGILQSEGYDLNHRVVYRVVDTETGVPRKGVPVVLDRTFTQLSDSSGTLSFFALEQSDSKITIASTYHATLSQLP